MITEHVTVEADSASFSRGFNPVAQARLKAPLKSDAKEYQNYAKPWPATTQIRLMDLNLFRVFDAIMLHRSVRKASQTLSVTRVRFSTEQPLFSGRRTWNDIQRTYFQ